MSDLHKDIFIGAVFIVGMSCFISGLFIMSALLFATASMFSNMSGKAALTS